MTDDDDKFSTMMGVEEHKTHILTITNNKLYFDQNRETFKELFENLGKYFPNYKNSISSIGMSEVEHIGHIVDRHG